MKTIKLFSAAMVMAASLVNPAHADGYGHDNSRNKDYI